MDHKSDSVGLKLRKLGPLYLLSLKLETFVMRVSTLISMKKSILLILFIAMSIMGCKKERIQTDSERTTEHIKSVISENKLGRIAAYSTGETRPSSMLRTDGTQFSFKDGYVSLLRGENTVSYNLALLKNYEIQELVIVNTVNGDFQTRLEKTLILMF